MTTGFGPEVAASASGIVQATTSNYFTLVQADEAVAPAPEPAAGPSKADKEDARRRRMEEAVARGKLEYKDEHAYTERGWVVGDASARLNASFKVDRQLVEYLTSAHLASATPDPAAALAALIPLVHDGKPLGGLSRELLETALIAAMRVGDRATAGRLARVGRSSWRGQFAVFAQTCSDALVFSGDDTAAILPLLYVTATYGLHAPVLSRLAARLAEVAPADPATAGDMRDLARVVGQVAAYRARAFRRPIFDDARLSRPGSARADTDADASAERGSAEADAAAADSEPDERSDGADGRPARPDVAALRAVLAALDLGRITAALELDAEADEILGGAVRRLAHGVGGGGEVEPDTTRGVHQL
ncbi:hypothetical protein Q5752_005224 [Cryptotrichosporon argae]